MSVEVEEYSMQSRDFSREINGDSSVCPPSRREMLDQWREQRRQSLAKHLLKSSKENYLPEKLQSSNRQTDSQVLQSLGNKVMGNFGEEFDASNEINNFPCHISRSDMIELCRQAQKDKLASRFLGKLKEYNADRRKTLDGMIASKSLVGTSKIALSGEASKKTTSIGKTMQREIKRRVTIAPENKNPVHRAKSLSQPVATSQPRITAPLTTISKTPQMMSSSATEPKRETTSVRAATKFERKPDERNIPKVALAKVAAAPLTKINKAPQTVSSNATETKRETATARTTTKFERKPVERIHSKLELRIPPKSSNAKPRSAVSKAIITQSCIATSHCNKLTSGQDSKKGTSAVNVRNARITGATNASVARKEGIKTSAKNINVQSVKPIAKRSNAQNVNPGFANSKARVSISTVHRMKTQSVAKADEKQKPSSVKETAPKVGFATPGKTPCHSRHGTPYPTSGRSSVFKVANLPNAEHDQIKKRMLDWMKKRGKSPNRFSHYSCFGLHASDMNDDKKDAGAQSTSVVFNEIANEECTEANANNVAQTAEELTTLLQEFTQALDEDSLPAEDISAWLDGLLECFHEDVVKHANYWVCRAKIARKFGDGPAAIECVSTALAASAEPAENPIKFKKQFNKRVTIAPIPARHIDEENICESTLYKYALADKSHLKRNPIDCGTADKKELVFATATPVRRSGRKSCKPDSSTLSWTPLLPPCIDTLEDIPQEFRPKILFTPNPKLDLPID